MAKTPKGMARFAAEVVSVAGQCGAGHRPGDRLSLSCWDSGGLCGYFYHDIFPYLMTQTMGGEIPWARDGVLSLECPDRHNLVTIRLARE
jgi:uncharacterized repeat protein (TIGR04076 family)